MLCASWLRRLATSSAARSGRRGPRPTLPRRSILPCLEVLEGRIVPSTLTVQNNLDHGTGSLRAVIAAAHSGDTIVFAPSVHDITLTSGQLAVNKNLDIDGPGADMLTIGGNDASRVFDVSNNATVTIDQLTIADGQIVGGNGGGILNEAGATLNLDHVVVTDNSAYADASGNYGSGGGVENDGSLTVMHSTFTNNLASGGSYTDPVTEGSAGGAINSEGPSLAVTITTFTDNKAVGPSTGTGEGNGGAINNSSTATITNSTFNGNEALGRTTNGGAISTGENELTNPDTDPLAISDCTFTCNQAVGANGANNSTELYGGEALGGAIANASPLTITGSTFTDNVAKGGDQGENLGGVDPDPILGEVYGGGIVNFASSLTVTATAFIGNRAIGGNSAAGPGAPAAGGGIAAEIFSVTTLTDVTFAGNQATGGSGGPGSPGGGGFGGGFYNGVDSTASVSQALFLDNRAVGGAGGSGATGGVGAGGAIANGGGAGAFELVFLGLGADTSSVSLAGSLLTFNAAQGGAGGAGGNGGSGLGGGAYNGATTTLALTNDLVTLNRADGGQGKGGGADGEGIGGGFYTLGTYTDLFTLIVGNDASTSGDNIGS